MGHTVYQVTEEQRRLDRLAFQFGVGVSTPSYSNRQTYFFSSVAAGGQIEARINAVGGGVSNMSQLQQKELEQSPAYIAEQKRLAAVKEAARLAEIARLTLIAKNDQIALALWTKLDNQRIAKQQAEIKRLAQVEEAQIQADINAENLRTKLLNEEKELQRITQLKIIQVAKDKESKRVEKAIPLLASLIPISAIGLLLLYSSKGKL